MADATEMDENKRAITERLINLTLEIIYLLTGENYGPIKKPIDLPPPSWTPVRSNVKQILKVTQKIVELLTGEVPIRCQDVTVYFSMEEWEYLEGHKDLYKHILIGKQPTVTSPGPTEDSPAAYISGRIKRERSCEDLPSDPDVSTPACHRLSLCSPVKKEPLSGLETKVSSFEISTSNSHTQSPLRLDKEEPLLAGEHLPTPEVSMLTHDIPNQSTYSEEQANSHGAHFLHYDTSQKEFPLIEEQSVSAEEGNIVDLELNTTTQHLQLQANKQGQQAKANPVICSECGKSCWCETKLHIHRKIYTRWKPFSCFECGKCFPTNSAYRTHKRVHTGEKPYTCSECGKCFRSTSDLRNHRRTHTGEKPFCCSDCGLTFSRSSNLARHRRRHTGDKPFSCQECDKRFVSSSHLATHQRIHTGVKPYCCSDCSKQFSSSSGLKKHQKIHLEERPHPCMVCGRRFKSASNLARHRHIHTGQRPHRCSACGKCFTRKEDLLKHQTSKGHDMRP